MRRNLTRSLPTILAAGLFCLAGSGLSAQVQENRLLPSDVVPGHHSGHAVAVRGKVAVVTAFRADAGATDSGAAYVFELDGTAWKETAKLVPSDPMASGEFGSAVAIDGRAILIGASNVSSARGAAYVFEKDAAGAWAQTAKLVANDGVAGDNFGFATAIDGNTLIVGAWGRDGIRGAAYVFERQGSGWMQTATLVAPDAAASDYFGHTVSIEGDTAIIGSPADDDMGLQSGSAYVFTRSIGIWTQTAKLRASDGASNDFLARTGSISNGTVVLGARDDDDLGSSSGSAYVFEQRNGLWTQTAKLRANDGKANDIFGHAVAIDGDRIVVGAKWRDDNGTSSGAAYLFVRNAGTWSQLSRLNASDAATGAAFGSSVAIDGRNTLVGAWLAYSNRGTAYLYAEPSPVDAGTSTVDASVASMPASGGSATITVTPRRADGSNVGTGLQVAIRATCGSLVGAASDNGDGTYSQEFLSAPGAAEVVCSAVADGVQISDTATITLIAVSADTSTVTVDPSTITAGESAMIVVSAKAADGSSAGAGLSVTIRTTLGTLVGAVNDNGDGTYSQRIDTTTHGSADITATVEGIDLVDGATLSVQPQIIGNVVGFRADDASTVYRTIQHAVDSAAQDGLVKIVVAPGRYDEVVRIHRLDGLRLETVPTLGLTTIRGLRVWRSRNIDVSGFEVDAGATGCSGVSMFMSSGVRLSTMFVHGARGNGITVGVCCGSVSLEHCLVQGNGQTGVRVFGRSGARILRSTIRRNRTGVDIGRGAVVHIEGCAILENAGEKHGKGSCNRSGYGVFADRSGSRRARNPERITLCGNAIAGNSGRVVPGRSDANCANYDTYIDATDDQEPYTR